MATREELERVRLQLAQLVEGVAKGIGELASLAGQRLDGPSDEQLDHAREYSETAGVLRRRAAKQNAAGDREAAVENWAKADRFEARAAVVRRGGVMPRELRTPSESLARVDSFRRALVQVMREHSDVESDELEAFRGAMVRAARARGASVELADFDLAELDRFAFAILAPFGVVRDDATGNTVFAPFSSPRDEIAQNPIEEAFFAEPPTKSETRRPMAGPGASPEDPPAAPGGTHRETDST